MRKIVVALCLALSGAASAQDGPLLEAFIDGRIDVRDNRVTAADRDMPPVLWVDEISVLGADYIRLLLRVEGPAFPAGAHVKLVGAFGQQEDVPLDTIGPEGHWTNLLPSGRARMALVSDQPVHADTVLIIDSVAMQSTQITPYSTHGENNLAFLNDAEVPDHLRALGGPIAFLSFIQNGFARTCTGFLIAPDRLVTNEHCINSDATCRSMTASFGYEIGEDGRLGFGPQRRCAKYEADKTNFALDVSVVELDSAPGPEFGQVDILDPGTLAQQPLVIVQHPGSAPKQISIIDCAAVETGVEGRAPGTDFSHTCDTAGGSSGAPVFDHDGRLVGLHHFGFEDGDAWTENRGVHIDPISDWLKTVLEDETPPTDGDPSEN